MDASTPTATRSPPTPARSLAELRRSLPKVAGDTREAIAARAGKAPDTVCVLHQEDQFETDPATGIVAMHAPSHPTRHEPIERDSETESGRRPFGTIEDSQDVGSLTCTRSTDQEACQTPTYDYIVAGAGSAGCA